MLDPLCFYMLTLLLCSLLGAVAHCTEPNVRKVEEILNEAREKRMADDRYWHVLLHYRKTYLGGFKSEADARAFFNSADGKRDPASELEATIRAFFGPPLEDSGDGKVMHSQCRFPARLAFLRERLNLDSNTLPDQPCPRLKRWLDGIDAGGVSLIFASSYLNNAASMYGHTFLKVGKKHSDASRQLLDYVINFGAVTNVQNGMLYALKGLVGLHPGHFHTVPYYLKIQEYTNIESRDLWEYKLNFNQRQIDRLILHAWELGSTHFDYYFIDENCSYQLLPLLEAAEPKLILSQRFHVRVIPTDTLKIIVEEAGLVGEPQYRPSHVSMMLHRRTRLNREEIQMTRSLADNGDDATFSKLELLPRERRAWVLDSAHDLFLYKEGFHRQPDDPVKERERRILLDRAALGQVAGAFEPAPPPPPETGHNSGRLTLAAGSAGGKTFGDFSWRWAYHDLAARPDGYSTTSHLEMIHPRLRVQESGKVFMEDFVLFHIVSLTPLDPWIRRPSWKLLTGLDRAKELGCAPEACPYYDLKLGAGLSFKIKPLNDGILYILAEQDSGLGNAFRDRYRLGSGGSAGILFNLARFWRVHTLGSLTHYSLGHPGTRRELRAENVFILLKDIDIRVSGRWANRYHETSASINYYY